MCHTWDEILWAVRSTTQLLIFFWILFSLLIGGKLLGFVGLIIGVPLFVFIYSIIKDIVEARLERKGLPIETKNYYE